MTPATAARLRRIGSSRSRWTSSRLRSTSGFVDSEGREAQACRSHTVDVVDREEVNDGKEEAVVLLSVDRI